MASSLCIFLTAQLSARHAVARQHQQMLMISRTALDSEAAPGGPLTPETPKTLPAFVSLLLLSAWCGLVAGLLEVATIVLRKQFFDPDRLYKLSRYFVWLIPVVNLGIFLALGLLGCAIIVLARQRGRWLVNRALAQ